MTNKHKQKLLHYLGLATKKTVSAIPYVRTGLDKGLDKLGNSLDILSAKIEKKEEETKKVVEQKQEGYCTIEDFAKIELKVGRILEYQLIEGADKLYRFLVDVGEEAPRTILSGIREYFPDGEIFIGRYVSVVANLAPRKMRGFESNGMLLFAGGGSEAVPGNLFMVSPLPNQASEPKPGTIIR